jgi:hypothetical protein
MIESKMVRVWRRTKCRFKLEHRGGHGFYLSTIDDIALCSGASKQEIWDWLEAFQRGHDHAINTIIAETGHIVVPRLMRDIEDLVREHIAGNKGMATTTLIKDTP